MSCGLLFNRHKWKYLDKENKICSKCGECQTYSNGIEPGWLNITYDKLMRNIRVNSSGRERKQMEARKREKEDVESRKKALEYLRGEVKG